MSASLELDGITKEQVFDELQRMGVFGFHYSMADLFALRAMPVRAEDQLQRKDALEKEVLASIAEQEARGLLR